jgi:hypothetical protein
MCELRATRTLPLPVLGGKKQYLGLDKSLQFQKKKQTAILTDGGLL